MIHFRLKRYIFFFIGDYECIIIILICGYGIAFSQVYISKFIIQYTPEAALRLSRVLRNDPGMGVIRHADAGYETAQQFALEHELDIRTRLKNFQHRN